MKLQTLIENGIDVPMTAIQIEDGFLVYFGDYEYTRVLTLEEVKAIADKANKEHS